MSELRRGVIRAILNAVCMTLLVVGGWLVVTGFSPDGATSPDHPSDLRNPAPDPALVPSTPDPNPDNTEECATCVPI